MPNRLGRLRTSQISRLDFCSVAALAYIRRHAPKQQHPSRHPVPQATVRDKHKFLPVTSQHVNPAIPHVEARFHKRPLETHISAPYVDTRFHEHQLETHICGSTPLQQQPFPMQTLETHIRGAVPPCNRALRLKHGSHNKTVSHHRFEQSAKSIPHVPELTRSHNIGSFPHVAVPDTQYGLHTVS